MSVSSSKESASFSASILSAALSVPAQAEECSTLINAPAQVHIYKHNDSLAFFSKAFHYKGCFLLALLVSCLRVKAAGRMNRQTRILLYRMSSEREISHQLLSVEFYMQILMQILQSDWLSYFNLIRSQFLSGISLFGLRRHQLSPFNLLSFYYECCSLIGHATHYLFRCDIGVNKFVVAVVVVIVSSLTVCGGYQNIDSFFAFSTSRFILKQ